VIGLLEGLGELFATPVTICHEQRQEDGADHDVFQVNWKA
jgi:hypothetical protein